MTSILRGFEDDERPATAPTDLASELLGCARAIDPDGDSAAARMTAASAAWLATNAEQAEHADHVLREAARLQFGSDPPETIPRWLEERGIQV